MFRTVKGNFRSAYRPARRHRLERCVITLNQPTRFVTLMARESAVDWQGSYYRNTVTEFVGFDDGWRWGETIYPTLLRAVRAAIAAGC